MRYIIILFLIISSLSTLSFASPGANHAIRHRIDVSINIEDRTMEGLDKLYLKKGAKGEIRLRLRRGSKIDNVEMYGKKLRFVTEKLTGKRLYEILISLPPNQESIETTPLLISFHGSFPDISKARKNIRRGIAFVNEGVIGKEGAFMPSSSAWYPQEKDETALYEVTINTPNGFEAIMEGEWIGRDTSGNGRRVVNHWKTHNPLQGINMVVGKYVIDKDSYKNTDLYTFFFKKDARLSRRYIEKAKEYLDLYEGLFPPYPFKKFAVVESFLPTGYGMPSFTLLGSVVLRLPFIPETSLGHEIVHNWWGNSVFIDNSLGNWAEALTTYTADYLYSERRSNDEAMEYRRRQLTSYRNYARNEEIALKDFLNSTTSSSRAVGYNKGTMVFHMLRRLVGNKVFFQSLRELYNRKGFQKASWKDIRAAFEEVSGKNLERFFEEWLSRKGGPELSIKDATIKEVEGGILVSLTVIQKKPPYLISLPILFETEGGKKIWDEVKIEEPVEKKEFLLADPPLSIEIDPEYENFRILSDEEIPPSLSAFLGDRDGIIIIPSDEASQRIYQPLADMIAKEYDLNITTDMEMKKTRLKETSFFIFGGPDQNNLFKEIEGDLPMGVVINNGTFQIGDKRYSLSETVLVLAIKNPSNPAKVVCLTLGRIDGKGMMRIGRRIPHLTGKGYLIFKQDGRLEAGTFKGNRVLKYRFKD
ncbi:MAG: M1 family aminopeptidase [Thermodesulfobacteriota bacterium]